MEKFLAFIGGLVWFAALLFFSAVWSGYVLTILWGWFIVPAFKLPILSIPVAIGMTLIIRYLTSGGGSHIEKKENKEWHTTFIIAFAKPLAVLFLGWIVIQFL